MTEPSLLTVSGLEVAYHLEEGASTALQDVELRVRPGEILGVVGESGSGKSTLSAALLRLLPPNAEVQGGKVLLKGRNLLVLGKEELRRVRGRDLVMIFQDPMLSLNPTFPVGSQMVEVLRSHLEGRRPGDAELRAQAVEALTAVGIPDAAERFANYPHEFSGGMRQRIIIAMALLLKPAVLIADEPTSALDVTLEAQILELLRRLRESEGTAILLVSHDLRVSPSSVTASSSCTPAVSSRKTTRSGCSTIRSTLTPGRSSNAFPRGSGAAARWPRSQAACRAFLRFQRDANSPIGASMCRASADRRSRG